MNPSHSDALVFFAATGDLAYKKIFPSLQAMIKRGNLSVPIIGVAKAGWDLDKLKSRAHDGVETHGGVSADHRRTHSLARSKHDLTGWATANGDDGTKIEILVDEAEVARKAAAFIAEEARTAIRTRGRFVNAVAYVTRQRSDEFRTSNRFRHTPSTTHPRRDFVRYRRFPRC